VEEGVVVMEVEGEVAVMEAVVMEAEEDTGVGAMVAEVDLGVGLHMERDRDMVIKV
jgi:hypothetical protein